MGLVTRRLNALWLRQTHPPHASPPNLDQSAAKMFVKLTEPLRIGTKALPPGAYVFRLSDAEGRCNSAQILNEDQTKLIATISAFLD